MATVAGASSTSMAKIIEYGSKTKIFGFSKMFVQSLIFALAGILATFIINFINKRKAAQLKALEDEEKKEA